MFFFIFSIGRDTEKILLKSPKVHELNHRQAINLIVVEGLSNLTRNRIKKYFLPT